MESIWSSRLKQLQWQSKAAAAPFPCSTLELRPSSLCSGAPRAVEGALRRKCLPSRAPLYEQIKYQCKELSVTIVSSLYNPSYAWLGCFCAWNLIESPVACFCSKLLRFPSNKKNYQYKKIINTKKIISTKKIINTKKLSVQKIISTKKISSKLNRNPIFTNIYQCLPIFTDIYQYLPLTSPCGRRKIYQQMEIMLCMTWRQWCWSFNRLLQEEAALLMTGWWKFIILLLSPLLFGFCCCNSNLFLPHCKNEPICVCTCFFRNLT